LKDIDTLYQSIDVHDMFSRVVRTYDLLNHLFSFDIDRAWRTRLVRMANLAPGSRVADIATGSADLAIAFARACRDCKVSGVDFVSEMLARGQEKVARAGLSDRIELVLGDALSLPWADESFDAAFIAFGLRNLNEGGIREMARVVWPGGKIMILEFSPPSLTLFGGTYQCLKRVMPALGGRISGWEPTYAYLYSSISAFLDQEALAKLHDVSRARPDRDRSAFRRHRLYPRRHQSERLSGTHLLSTNEATSSRL